MKLRPCDPELVETCKMKTGEAKVSASGADKWKSWGSSKAERVSAGEVVEKGKYEGAGGKRWWK